MIRAQSWIKALVFALPISALILGLIYYWFGIADRYTVFLYYHDMGPLVPDTSPFSRVTSSRYWMAGLVANGAVMVFYTAVNLVLGRFAAGNVRYRRYRPPAWWRVWLLNALPLLIGIPAITMTLNEPTLPVWNTIQVALATLIGLALALQPGKLAADQPSEVLLLAFDGLGIMLVMLNINSLERLGGWLARGALIFIFMGLIALAAGLFLLLAISVFRVWRSRPGQTLSVFLATLCLSYLFMPLLHHVGFTDGYFYISDSDNFFAQSLVMQLISWIVAAAIAFGLTRLRQYLIRRENGDRRLVIV